MGGFVARVTRPKPRPVSPAVQRAAVKAAPAGPTIAEMRQDGRAVGRRGRRATILTSSKGVDEDITLGYKTLLG
jgi:hypothetical protein